MRQMRSKEHAKKGTYEERKIRRKEHVGRHVTGDNPLPYMLYFCVNISKITECETVTRCVFTAQQKMEQFDCMESQEKLFLNCNYLLICN